MDGHQVWSDYRDLLLLYFDFLDMGYSEGQTMDLIQRREVRARTARTFFALHAGDLDRPRGGYFFGWNASLTCLLMSL
jgi:hypothetical protein